MNALVLQVLAILDRRGGGGGCGVFGCFFFLMIIGLVVFLIMKGRRDRPEQVAAPKRPMSEGPVEAVNFASPYAKCPACGAPGDKMKHQWDGMRKVSWTCGYCASQAGVQELRDEELPASARRRLGLDQPIGQDPSMGYGQPGMPYPPQGSGLGGVAGGVLGGMMLGSMLGGGHHHHGHSDGWGGSRGDGSGGDGGWGDAGGSSGNADWGESDAGGSGWGDSGDSGGSDWGDSGGGDSGGDW